MGFNSALNHCELCSCLHAVTLRLETHKRRCVNEWKSLLKKDKWRGCMSLRSAGRVRSGDPPSSKGWLWPKCGHHRPQFVAGNWAILTSKLQVNSLLRLVQGHKWQEEPEISITPWSAQTREKSAVSLKPQSFYSQGKNLSYAFIKIWAISTACPEVLQKIKDPFHFLESNDDLSVGHPLD